MENKEQEKNANEIPEAEVQETKVGKDKKVKILSSELEELKSKAAERDDFEQKWLRIHADYENTRKRMEKEKSDSRKFANELLILELFPIVDNFDMALDSMDKTDDKESVMKGIKMVQGQFHKILEENGVEKIKTTDEKFDPNMHEAVFAEESEEEEGKVLEEMRPGYLMNGRLLRPAQVKVAKNKEVDNG